MSRTATRDRFVSGFRIGDYRIERELSSEETGMVYEAVHLVLPRRVNIKVMHSSEGWLKALAVQMLREACVLEALSHPGVPRVYECGVLPDKRPWVAVELVEGTPLIDTIETGPLGVSDLVVMMRAIAEVLVHAHARGVVHHRLSELVVIRTPARASCVCIRGWGDVSVHDSDLAADPSSDVLALGALAFRALTGSLLLPDESAAHLCPSVPAELTDLIDQMLAPDPALRPTIVEVHDRAVWLAETLELVPHPKSRWTPAYGVAPEPPRVEEGSGAFQIRINRT